MPVAAGRG